MKKFIVIYHAPMTMMEQATSMSPEQQAEGMKAWMDWAAKCGNNLVDIGQPLAKAISLSMEGNKEGDQSVTGFSVLQAENMNDAITLMQGHPHMTWNAECSIQIHECMPLPGM